MPLTAEICLKNRERAEAVKASRLAAAQLEKKLLLSPQNRTAVSALRNVCYALLRIVQKHVTRASRTHSDYSEVLQLVRILKELGFNPPQNEEFAAASHDISAAAVLNSRDYRYTRNRAIACLSTIADLTEKPPASGSTEYQRGMREGYRRASEIAAKFLADFIEETQNEPATNTR
jgi:hypothetical protein